MKRSTKTYGIIIILEDTKFIMDVPVAMTKWEEEEQEEGNYSEARLLLGQQSLWTLSPSPMTFIGRYLIEKQLWSSSTMYHQEKWCHTNEDINKIKTKSTQCNHNASIHASLDLWRDLHTSALTSSLVRLLSWITLTESS